MTEELLGRSILTLVFLCFLVGKVVSCVRCAYEYRKHRLSRHRPIPHADDHCDVEKYF